MGRVLLTGAGGFIGRHLCGHLLGAGYRVYAAVRDPAAHPRAAVGAERVALDLGRPDLGDLFGNDIDCVVHLAAHVHVSWPGRMRAGQFLRVNAAGTARLAEAAARHGVRRFIFASTAGVHGAWSPGTGDGIHRFTELDPPRPHNAYARSKLLAEEALRSACKSAEMEPVILRMPLVFGAGMRSHLPWLVWAIQRGIPLPLSGVQARRTLVYVLNLVRVIEQCIDSPGAAGRTFLVGDFDIGVEEMVSALARFLGRPERLWPCPEWAAAAARVLPVIGRPVNSLTRSFLVDSGAIRKALAWTPPIGAAPALEAFASAYANRR